MKKSRRRWINCKEEKNRSDESSPIFKGAFESYEKYFTDFMNFYFFYLGHKYF